MNLEFQDFEFAGIGRAASDGTKMWGKLSIGLKDTDGGRVSRVDLHLFLSKRPDITLSELQSEARDHARTVLREALSYLEAHDVATLKKMDRDKSSF